MGARRGFCKVLLALVLIGAHAYSADKGKWGGMSARNDRYDWLRPPESAVEAGVKAFRSGHVDKRMPVTARIQHRLSYFPLSKVFGTSGAISLSLVEVIPPSTAMAYNVFQNFGNASMLRSEVRRLRGAFMVIVEVDVIGEVPFDGRLVSVAVPLPDRDPLLPTETPEPILVSTDTLNEVGTGQKIADRRYATRFTFVVSDNVNLVGLGRVVIRFGDGTERSVPIDFDYLW